MPTSSAFLRVVCISLASLLNCLPALRTSLATPFTPFAVPGIGTPSTFRGRRFRRPRTTPPTTPAAAVATGTATVFIVPATPPPLRRAALEFDEEAERGVLFGLLEPFPRDRELLARELLERALLARELWLRELERPDDLRLRLDALPPRPLDAFFEDRPDDRLLDDELFFDSAILLPFPRYRYFGYPVQHAPTQRAWRSHLCLSTW